MASISGVRWRLVVICCVCICGVHCYRSTAEQGFNDKLMNAKEQLTNSLYQTFNDSSNITMEATLLWTKSFNELYTKNSQWRGSPWVVRTGNYTLLLSQTDLWLLKEEGITIVSTLPTRVTYNVHLVKGMEWDDKLFLLVCFITNQCSLYTSSSDFAFSFRQPLSDAGIPIDAQFFVQNDNLFLTVLYQALHSKISQPRIYRWRNTQLDSEPMPEITSTASSITVFGYKDTVVLILGCSGNDKIKFPSQVWSRQSDWSMNKVQHLPTVKPLSITHFIARGENFLFIQEEQLAGTVWWWEGSEFVKWIPVLGELNHFKVAVSSNIQHAPPFLMFFQGTFLKVYFMTSKKLEQVLEAEIFVGDPLKEVPISSITLYEENKNLLMLVHSKSEVEEYQTLFQMKVGLLSLEEPNSKQHTNQETVNHVFSSIQSLSERMSAFENTLSRVLFTNRPCSVNSAVAQVLNTVNVKSGTIWNLTNSNTGMFVLVKSTFAKVIDLQKEYTIISRSLQSYQLHENRHLIFEGDVHLHQARIKALVANMVNDKPFDPDLFLSLTKNVQKVDTVRANTLKANWLVLKEIGDKPIRDLVLKGSTIEVPVEVAQLEGRNMRIQEDALINSIKSEYLTSKEVTVVAEEDFNDISQVLLKSAGGLGRRSSLKLGDQTVIENLNVDVINNISTIDLFNNLFVQNTDRNIINGSVRFLKGLSANELFSMSTEHSSVNRDPLSPGLQYLRTSLQQSNQTVHNIPLPAGKRKKRNSKHTNESVNVVKTTVKILGNLKVGRLLFRNSSLIINSSSVPTKNLDKVFWTHSTPQDIPGPVHFRQGVSLLSGLEDPVVNGKSLTHYASRRSTFNNLVLEEVHIVGNITSGQGINPAVWRQSYHEHEFKRMKCRAVKVKHLVATYINGEQLQNALQKDHLSHGDINIITGNLTITGNLEAKLINKVDVKKKFETAVMTNIDNKLDNMNFKRMTATRAKVEYLNKFRVDQLVGLVSPELITSVHIDGNLHVSQLSNVSFINYKTANLSLVVNKGEDTPIFGRKSFPYQVSTQDNVRITKVNNMNVEDLFKNLLKKSSNQEIPGSFTFRKASMKILNNVTEINGANTSSFIYINQPIINVTGDFHFTCLLVQGNLTATTLFDNCTLPKVGPQVVFEGPSVWSSVWVTGDSEWPSTPAGRLHHLMDCAVTNGTNQTISGNVIFSNLYIKTIQVNKLNDKNITFIFQDSLSRRRKNQVISGKKHFTGVFKCNSIDVKGEAALESVNDIDINDIDTRLVRHSIEDDSLVEPVHGHKTFMSGFKAFILNCTGGINGIKAVNLAREGLRELLPPVVIYSLHVDNLQVERINGLHIDSFLQQCIFTNSTKRQVVRGQLKVEGNVTFLGNITAARLNNIVNSELVFVKGENPIMIHGCKTFKSNIHTDTDIEVGILNGRSLVNSYEESLKKNQNATINGYVVILSEVELDTIYAQKYFVGERKLLHINNNTVVP